MPLELHRVDCASRSAVRLGGIALRRQTQSATLTAARPSRSASAANSRRAGGTAFAAFVGLALALALAGCHSAYISATVSNRTDAPITLVQVEYPSASFGIQTIAPGQDFHYRFKILGSGSMKITYTDASQHDHKATGPTLQEGNEGALGIVVASDGVHWQAPPASH